jgi:ABC-type glutathione transport system ATPase component
MMPLLHVRDLRVRYKAEGGSPRPAVAGVSFHIAPGETLGLMGESGCGKSTIALSLLGLLSAGSAVVSGSIEFQGEELLSRPERELQKIRGAAIAMVSQEPELALSPVIRVGDQVAEVLRAHHDWDAKKCRIEAEAILALAGLTQARELYSAYPHQLSGGQRQRVVLAQALACRPALVIADEPTASLDALSQSAFIALLRDLKRKLQISLLLISHTPEIQASLADRVLVMKDGEIVEEGTFAQLYRKSGLAYTRTILRSGAGAWGREQERHDWDSRSHFQEVVTR